ncbi:MAG: T9SS type A sorting domain-containing protein [Flavobacteriales bacterium]|nr:T9SS type A sorting domain-containing protein [Flavobacteriales bacterium]
MKTLLFFLAFAVSNCVVSQTIVPFPDSIASWTNVDSYYTITGPNPITDQVVTITNIDEFCMNDLDTVINSTDYVQLDNCSGTYVGALRDSSGVITYVPKDSTEAYLLYDFNAQLDDTLSIYVYDYDYMITPQITEAVVFGIDSVDIGDGIQRKSLELYADGSNYNYSLFAISGIGSTSGLFRAQFANVSNSNTQLFCMTENNITLFPSYNTTCGNASINENEVSFFEVYPNPSTDKLHIKGDFGNNQVTVTLLTTLGAKVIQKTLHPSNMEINVSALSRGMYLVQVKDETGKSATVPIFKE